MFYLILIIIFHLWQQSLSKSLTSVSKEECLSLKSASKYVSSVAHCWLGSKRHGYFSLKSSGVLNPSIRGRLTGTILQELRPNRTTDVDWKFYYHVPFGGRYHVFLRIEFENFHFSNYTEVGALHQPIISNYIFQSPRDSNYKRGIQICPSGISRRSNGYWMPVMNSTVSFNNPEWHLGTYSQEELEQFDLEYHAFDCQLITHSMIRDCINGLGNWKDKALRLCSYGDSSMRHTHNSLDTLYNDSNNFFYWAADKFEKSIKTSVFARFSYDEWGNCFRPHKRCRHNLRDMPCDYVLLNIGSWPALYKVSPSEYGQIVRDMLNLAKVRIGDRKLIWLTTHPNGDREELYMNPPQDFRTHTLLKTYNDVAIALCKELGVAYIDVFRVASVVNDLTYDGFHYKLPVEREVAKVVAHELCQLSLTA